MPIAVAMAIAMESPKAIAVIKRWFISYCLFAWAIFAVPLRQKIS
jgi:hypothetical protein